MANNLKNYDGFQVLKSVFDPDTNCLRVCVVEGTTGEGAGFEVIISHINDSIKLGDGIKLYTGTTVGAKHGLDISVISSVLPSGAATEVKQDTQIARLDTIILDLNSQADESQLKLDTISTDIQSLETSLISEFDETQINQNNQTVELQNINTELDGIRSDMNTQFDESQVNEVGIRSDIQSLKASNETESASTRSLLQTEFDETQVKQDTQITELQSINTELDTIRDNQTNGTQQAIILDADSQPFASRIYGLDRSLSINFGETGQKDSFERIRVSPLKYILGTYHSFAKHSFIFTEDITGTASSTLNTTTASVDLNVDVASGDQIIRQTKRYIHYNPARSYLITISGRFGHNKAGVRSRWGYFDAEDGIFFEQDGTSFSVVHRTSSSGSPVDTAITQANFNVDTFDGNGPSGLNLDLNTHNLYIIDYVWQGAGRVRLGVLHKGKIEYCHEFINDNVSPYPYMRTPSLPIRTELTNTAATGSPTSISLVCISANKESGDETVPGHVFSVDRGLTNTSVTANATRPIISLRPMTTFNGITNRVPILPREVPIISISNPLLVRVYINPTLTGAVWTPVDTESSAEYDISATTFTGGTKVKSFYVGGLAGQSAVTSFTSLSDILFLASDVLGTTTDIISVVVTNLGSGSTQVNAGLVWEEFQ